MNVDPLEFFDVDNAYIVGKCEIWLASLDDQKIVILQTEGWRGASQHSVAENLVLRPADARALVDDLTKLLDRNGW